MLCFEINEEIFEIDFFDNLLSDFEDSDSLALTSDFNDVCE